MSLLFKRAIQQLDLLLGTAGLVAGMVLPVVGHLYSLPYAVDYAFILLASCGAYLILRNRLQLWDGESQGDLDGLSNSLAVAIFLITLAASIAIIYDTLYERTLPFFILVALMCAIAAFEIVSFPLSKLATRVLLGQVFAIFLTVRLSLFLVYPSSMLGVDPWYHLSYSLQIGQTGHAPVASRYSDFPSMHLAVTAFSQVLSIDVRTSYILAFVFVELVGFLSVFLLARTLSNARVALMSTLVLSFLQTSVRWGWSLTPTTIGLSLMPLVVYLVLSEEVEHRLQYKVVTILLLFSLVPTHSLSTLVLFLLITALYSAFLLSRWLGRPTKPIVLDRTLLVLYTVGFLSYWALATGFIDTVTLTVKFGLQFTLRKILTFELDFPELVATRIGADLIQILALLGSLLMISPRYWNSKRFAVSLGGLALMAAAVGAQAFKLQELLPLRWVGFAQYLTVTAAALGLYSVSLLVRRLGYRRLVIIALISSFAVMNIMAPEASFDSPLATPRNSYRFALMESEMQGADFVSHISPRPILTDEHFRYYPPLYDVNATALTPRNIPTTSSGTARFFLLREYVVEVGLPIFTYLEEGTMKLPQGYEIGLASSAQWNRVYDSNTLSGYTPTSR